MFDIIRNRRGVALLMTIGILAIMSIIATSFALNMKLELESAANYLRSVKALYLAESGINKVIADIRSQVAINTYANVVSYVENYDMTTELWIDSIGTYKVTIGSGTNIGEYQKVNLNALDDTDYTAITALKTAGLTSDDIAKIIDYRDPDANVTSQICTAFNVALGTGTWENCTGNETGAKNSTFSSVEEVRLIIGDTKYNNIKDYITIYGPIIRGGVLAEYYNSISDPSPNVVIDKASFVGKVIELGEVCQYHWSGDAPQNCMPGADGDWNGWKETHDAAFAGASLLSDPGGNRINYFGVIFEGYLEILPSEIGSDVTFYMRNDDGARLFIDSTQVVNAYYDKGMDPEISGNYTFNYPGWHPIRIDYYDQADANGCALKWSLSGAADTSGSGNYIPAERLGFYPIITHPRESGISYPSAGIYSITCVGKAKATDGTVLAEKKVTAAVKVFGTWTQTTKEEFYAAWFSDAGTTTGATNASRYFQGNYADGHVFNVTWLDTCPDNASGNLEAGGYTTTVNALKLGYWDDFDEDLAYSVTNLTAMARKVIEGPDKQGDYGTGWWWKGYRNNKKPPTPTGYFALTFENIQPYMGNCKVQVDVDVWTELYFEVNYNFYRPETNVFARTWTGSSTDTRIPSERLGWRGGAPNIVLSGDWGKIKDHWVDVGGSGNWCRQYYLDWDGDSVWDDWKDVNGNGTYEAGVDTAAEPRPIYRVYSNPGVQIPETTARAYIYGNYRGPGTPNYAERPYEYPTYSATGAYWQPIVHFMDTYLFARGDRLDPWDAGEVDSCGAGLYAVLCDDDGWVYTTGDRLEVIAWDKRVLTPYQKDKVLAMIKGAVSDAYKGFLNNGAVSVEATPGALPIVPNFKFKGANLYDTWSWNSYNACWVRGVPDIVTSPDFKETNVTYWDNIRFIPNSGHLASTPFYAGENVTWGRLSWTEKNAADAQLDVAISLRTAADKASIPTGNTGWTSYANGAQITNTGRWLQYEATLTSYAFDKDNYANSGKTPIFQDITVTYLPQVEVLYYREVTE
ncbi:MAG: hypothetical protein ABH847_00600 [Candidatus Omnitrophota bacterium]